MRATTLVASVILLVGCATSSPSVTPSGSDPAPSPSAASASVPFTVTVGGNEVSGHCSGSRHPGEPAVILQSGNGGSDEDLKIVESHMRKTTLVCAWARPGAGDNSAPADLPRPVEEVVAEMHDILVAAEIGPPYFVVGQSGGAAVTFMFVQAYPDEVRGFVFMNGNPPYHPWLDIANNSDLGQNWIDAAEADFRGENPEQIDFRGNDSMLTIPLPASMPYAVLYDEDYSECACPEFAVKEGGLFEQLARVGDGGVFFWLHGAGHEIPQTKPFVMLQAIDDIWAQATGQG